MTIRNAMEHQVKYRVGV